MDWQPRDTMKQPPLEGQRVLYFFEPSGKWHIGEWDGGSHFTGRSGFCDWHDAPYWLPEPLSPRVTFLHVSALETAVERIAAMDDTFAEIDGLLGI